MTDIDFSYRYDEYTALMHAMQTGVKALKEISDNFDSANTDTPETSPKHLRVGVNAAMVAIGALVQTMVEAGLIDYEKYIDNQLEFIKRDIKSYEDRLQAVYGTKIHLS